MAQARMQAIIDLNIHFVRNGKIVEFQHPQHKIVDTDTMRSLSNKRFAADFWEDNLRGILTDSIYFVGIEGANFKIKFIDAYTYNDDKRTVIEFKKLTKDEYKKGLETIKNKMKAKTDAIAQFKSEFVKDNSWETPLKAETQTIELETLDKTIRITLPDFYDVDTYSGISSRNYAGLQIGAAFDNSKDEMFDLKNTEKDYGYFTKVFLITADKPKSSFDFEKYFTEYNDEIVLHKDKNSFAVLHTFYNDKTNEIGIDRFFAFKYFYVKNRFVLLESQLDVKNGNFEIAKEHYQVIKTLKAK